MRNAKWSVKLAKQLIEEKDEGAVAAALLRQITHENKRKTLECALDNIYTQCLETEPDINQIKKLVIDVLARD